MINSNQITEFEYQVLEAFDRDINPMNSVYSICRRLGNPQQHSKMKFYAKVYRALERLVEKRQVWVMRGVRDSSVYLAKRVVKGFDKNGVQDIPF